MFCYTTSNQIISTFFILNLFGPLYCNLCNDLYSRWPISAHRSPTWNPTPGCVQAPLTCHVGTFQHLFNLFLAKCPIIQNTPIYGTMAIRNYGYIQNFDKKWEFWSKNKDFSSAYFSVPMDA